MLQSKLFTKTRKEAPKDEVSKNAELLVRGGFVHKEMAGVYDYLPLGLRVLRKIENIIREEMNAIGGQEIVLSSLQNPESWKATDRWDDAKVDNWFKTKLKTDAELGLSFTNEEPLTALLRDHVHSYRDLPIYPYQITTKFRNELRAKSGVMRGREFLMKDLYSFSRTEKERKEFYEQCKEAYKKIFDRVGIGHLTFTTFASGGVFSKYSEEFQALSESGEDVIYISEAKKIAVNKEVYTDEVLSDLGLSREELTERKAIEVGNIFALGTRFSEALGLLYKDENGESKPVIMGSYGIGPSRLMGTIVEILSDDKGIVWPESVAPFKIHLVLIPSKNESVHARAEELYKQWMHEGVEVLFDDRDMGAGAKFSDADLLGVPYRAVISERTMAEGKIELTKRATGETKMVAEAELLDL